jgi:hypothetical protein
MSDKKDDSTGLLLQRRMFNTRGFGAAAECQERIVSAADADPAKIEGDLLSSVPAPADSEARGWQEVKG